VGVIQTTTAEFKEEIIVELPPPYVVGIGTWTKRLSHINRRDAKIQELKKAGWTIIDWEIDSREEEGDRHYIPIGK
jgi:hypothetical protein